MRARSVGRFFKGKARPSSTAGLARFGAASSMLLGGGRQKLTPVGRRLLAVGKRSVFCGVGSAVLARLGMVVVCGGSFESEADRRCWSLFRVDCVVDGVWKVRGLLLIVEESDEVWSWDTGSVVGEGLGSVQDGVFFLAKRKFWNDLVRAPSLRAWEGRLEGAGLRGECLNGVLCFGTATVRATPFPSNVSVLSFCNKSLRGGLRRVSASLPLHQQRRAV